METIVRLLLGSIDRIYLHETRSLAVHRYQRWKLMINITLHFESKGRDSTIDVVNTFRGK
jgi:hypothetical protein